MALSLHFHYLIALSKIRCSPLGSPCTTPLWFWICQHFRVFSLIWLTNDSWLLSQNPFCFTLLIANFLIPAQFLTDSHWVQWGQWKFDTGWPSLPCSMWEQNGECWCGYRLGFLSLVLSFQSACLLIQQFPCVHNALEVVRPGQNTQLRRTADIIWCFEVGHIFKSLVIPSGYSSMANPQRVVTYSSPVSKQQKTQVN